MNCAITGASSGIGRATALELASRGVRLVLVCRSPTRGAAILEDIAQVPGAPRPTLLLADLRSLGAVRGVADSLRRLGPLHALINNAGTISPHRTLTPEGLETTFVVNYLSGFLLTTSLLDVLRAGRPSRVVNVCSNVIRQFANLDLGNLQGERRYGPLRAYKQSKLAQAVFTFELARRVRSEGISVNCLHPGDVRTALTVRGFFIDLIRPLMRSTPAVDAARICADLAVASRWEGVTGQYVESDRAADPGKQARDGRLAEPLWRISEELVGRATAPGAARNPAFSVEVRG